MIGLKKEFTRKELLWFGPLFALFAALVGWIAWAKFGSPMVAKWIWIIAAVVVAIYYVAPPLRRWIFIGWMAAVFPIGWLLSHILLAAVFYLLVFPIGMMMRLFGHDALGRKIDPTAKSFWIEREQRDDPKRYFRQF